MDRDAVLAGLVEGINEVGGYDYAPGDLDGSQPITAYGVDSLNVMQVLASLESGLGLTVDQSRISESDFASVDSLLNYLLRLES
jgi:acyl carrier protein